MSFDDYAKYIYEKHRLCISLAIIKTKPPDLTVEQYINEIKSKIEENADSTVCSDDFMMESDDDVTNSGDDSMMVDDELNNSETILKDFDLDKENIIGEDACFKDMTQTSFNLTLTQYSPDIQNTDLTTNMDVEANMDTNKTTDSNKNPTESNNIGHNNIVDNNLPKQSSININASKPTPSNENTNKDTKTTKYVNENNITSDNKNRNETQDTYYDSQNTVLYSVHGFTQNYTHYSQSQTDVNIPNNLIFGPNCSTLNDLNKYENSTIIPAVKSNDSVKNNIEHRNKENTNEISRINDDNYNGIKVLDNNYQNCNNVANSNNRNNIENTKNLNVNEETHLTQDIDKYLQEMNSIGYLAKNTNVTQITDVNIINEFSENSLDIVNLDTIIHDHGYVRNKTENIIENDEVMNEKNDRHDTINANYCDANDHSMKTDNSNNQIENSQLKNKEIDKNINNIDNNEHTNEDVDQNNTKNVKISNENEELLENIKENTNLGNSISKNDIFEQENELNDSNELIPFKILQELNKAKRFLSKEVNLSRRLSMEGYSTDSGYKSDSQSRCSSRNALQLSCVSVNQSAQSLFNYLMESTCAEATREMITNEIAQTLGQVIDRLHEDEIYPEFLEELLSSIDLLISRIYEGNNLDANEYLNKDENIQRLFLLNYSIHIQEHSLAKITSILTAVHAEITEKTTTYEQINVNQTENLAYIFHILYNLLKKYIKNKDLSSQKLTQDSQKPLKKSSITEIWKKKWRPSEKDISINEGSHEKICVLKECSDVLNKLIVECVNEYSLIAFAALKCFNLIPS